jgi:hypothetical protein
MKRGAGSCSAQMPKLARNSFVSNLVPLRPDVTVKQSRLADSSPTMLNLSS